MSLLLTEVVILVVAGWLALRIATKPPFRRDLRELPRPWVAVGLALVLLGGVTGVWLMVRWPVVRHLGATLALMVMVATWIRARPGYGAGKQWPPGSLGIGQSLDAIYDRTFYGDQVHLYGPVFKMSQFGRPVVCVLGFKRARDLLQGQSEALAGASLPYNRSLAKGALRYMTVADHQAESGLFRSALGGLDFAASEASIRTSCRAMLSPLSPSSGKQPEGESLRVHLEHFLQQALCRVFFGLEPADPRIPVLDRIVRATVVNRMGGTAWRRQLERAFEDATGIMRDIAREASMIPGRLAGTTLGGLLAADPDALQDPTRARNLFITFRLAHGDVTGLLDWVFTQLSRHPEWQERVRSAPRTTGEPRSAQPNDIASRVVLETLRLEQSEFLYRRVVKPLAIDGYRIPPGWLLRILVHESHRDPTVFPDPDRFDPDRFLARTFDKTEYSPFGADAHGCMGARLSLFLGRIFVEELCHGFHWRITSDGPLERGSRHRHHWRPSHLRRVAVQAIRGATLDHAAAPAPPPVHSAVAVAAPEVAAGA